MGEHAELLPGAAGVVVVRGHRIRRELSPQFGERPILGDAATHEGILGREATELYIARVGRFNVDANVGWASLARSAAARATGQALTHSQMQTLLGAIGSIKNFDVWIPPKDRYALDWSIAERFPCMPALPLGDGLHALLHEIDALWFKRGSREVAALYEVEHSTPIYSGLLRLNDVYLALPSVRRLGIVSNDSRRGLFTRQLQRPTFQRSGLSQLCAFLEYPDVLDWYRRLRRSDLPLEGADQ